MNVYGSTGSENAYFIDGVNTTGIEYGAQGKNLNFEFVQEINVKTGGYEAEFGRATGGTINVITKSGGNEFHGDVFGYDDRDSRQNPTSARTSGRSPARSAGRSCRAATRGPTTASTSAATSMKDKLWFFGAYNYVKNDSDHEMAADFTRFGGPNNGFLPVGTILPDQVKRNLWSGKLTYRATNSNSFIVSAFGDPTSETGPIGGGLQGGHRPLAGNLGSILGGNDSGGTDVTAKYEGVLGSNLGAQRPGSAAQGEGAARRRRREHPCTARLRASALPQQRRAADLGRLGVHREEPVHPRRLSTRTSHTSSTTSAATTSSSSASTRSTSASTS